MVFTRMECESIPVEISCFINPHLFWIINRADLCKRSKLENDLEAITLVPVTNTLRVGQYVLVKDDKLKRALVRYVQSDVITYWFIDYGIFYKSSRMVFRLPEEFIKIEPIARQAALYNVVCVRQTMKALDIELERSIYFNVGSIKCFKDHFRNAIAMSFLYVEKMGSVHVGELSLQLSGGVWYSVSQALVKANVVAFDRDCFKVALAENTKAETAFMQSTLNLKEHQHFLNLLEQYPPNQGKGRGIAPLRYNLNMPLPETNQKENSKNFDDTMESNFSTMPKSDRSKGVLRRFIELKRTIRNVN